MFTSVKVKRKDIRHSKVDLFVPEHSSQGGYHPKRINPRIIYDSRVSGKVSYSDQGHDYMVIRTVCHLTIDSLGLHINTMIVNFPFTPKPLGLEDNVEVGQHPQANALQRRPTRYNFLYPEVRGAAGFIKNVDLVCLSKSWVDHIFVRLEPQVQDFVEVRNPKTTAQLSEVLAKFEEIYSCKKMPCSINNDNVGRRGWNERKMSNHDDRWRNWRNSEVLHIPSSGRNDYRGW
ncbi:uncharacterized protein TNCV_220431 [Trichonephila clavipes]|nr:uncharacterized protein TNCV_220431 [Trichonephila clavipes]